MSPRAKRLFHTWRVIFWAIQIPPAVWAAYQPELERTLFAYLVVISLLALVESAATDADRAWERKQRGSSSE